MLPSLSRALAVTLALLVPIQGAAAVAAGVCMALGHHQSEGASQGQHEAQGHEHAHEGASHSGDAGVDEKDEGRASSCGPCVACCASASIATASLLTMMLWAPQAPYVSSQLDPSGVQPDGHDRPPLAL